MNLPPAVLAPLDAAVVRDVVADVVVDPDRATARRWAVEELTDTAYVQAQPGLLARALSWLMDQLSELLGRASGAGTGLGLVVGVAVVVVVVVLALVVAGPLRRGGRTVTRGGGVFTSVVRTAAEHRAEAERAARSGQWGPAVQERFRAVARSLEERVVLDARPGRTADEVAREAGDVLPGTGDRLLRAARVFDDVTYGGRPGTEAGYRECVEADDLVAAARPGRLAGAATAAP